MERPTYIASCSFGKDSLATILLAHEHGDPIDYIIFSEVMYDNARNISGENPEHIRWIKETAAPRLEALGYKVVILRSDDDYLKEFHTVIGERSKHKDRIGKLRGFLIPGRCRMNSDGKIAPIHKFIGQIDGDVVQYVGIAADESKRLARLDGVSRVSLLAKYGYTEKMAYELCKANDLLSPIYKNVTRGGCWFCPNQRMSELCSLRRTRPDLWKELLELGRNENLVLHKFNRTYTMDELEKRISFMERQTQINF